ASGSCGETLFSALPEERLKITAWPAPPRSRPDHKRLATDAWPVYASGAMKFPTIKSFLLGIFLLFVPLAIAQTVIVASAHVVNTFSPPHALGAAIDRLRTGTPDHLLTDPMLHEILGAGWGTVTYRQNTELMVEAWHWNPNGKWSNPEKQEGYFVGNAEPTNELIRHSWAAPLPHRG